MKRYKTHIVACDVKEFDRQLEGFINEGWDLVGGISITTDDSNDTVLFAQALTRVEGEEPDDDHLSIGGV